MLEELLNEINRGGTIQPSVLASRLDVSVSMVQTMLEYLEQRGILSKFEPHCNKSCKNCPLADACGTQPFGKCRLWIFAKHSAKSSK